MRPTAVDRQPVRPQPNGGAGGSRIGPLAERDDMLTRARKLPERKEETGITLSSKGCQGSNPGQMNYTIASISRSDSDSAQAANGRRK
jgi:hypothetical protein